MMRALLLALPLLLSACSEMPWYQQGFAVAVGLENQAVRDRAAFNDQRLKVTLDLICDASAGAVGRLGVADALTRAYILQHCGIISPAGVSGTGFGSAVYMGP